jgi:hypothetical protein
VGELHRFAGAEIEPVQMLFAVLETTVDDVALIAAER